MPHPALKAISEQASPADQWMNDDNHRYGALRESYAFEYAVYEQADKFKNTHFDFDTYDTYEWYLKLGPLSNINAKYLHSSIPAWNAIVAHPNYDAFNKREAWYTQIKGSDRSATSTSPGSGIRKTRGGRGRSSIRPARTIPTTRTSWSPGPWYHGSWHTPLNDSIGHHSARRARDGARVPREHRGAVLPLLPARQGRASRRGARRCSRPDRTRGARMTVAGEGRDAERISICTADGTLSFDKPAAAGSAAYREYRVGSGEPGAVPPATDLADVSGTATGAAGRSPTSDSSTDVRTCLRTRARRSITMSRSPARCRPRCSRRPPAPTPTSSSS